MKFAGALMIFTGLLGIMFTIRTPPGAVSAQATSASTAVGGVASGVA
jgi:hypothetical protein